MSQPINRPEMAEKPDTTPQMETTKEGSRRSDRIIAAGQCALAGALLVGPTVAVETAFRSQVEDSLGPFPISTSLRLGETRLSLLPQDNLYLDKSRFGFGLNVRLDGLPRGQANESGILSSALSPSAIQIYSGFINEPTQAAKGYTQALSSEIKDNLWKSEAIAISSTWLITAAGVGLTAKRRRKIQIAQTRIGEKASSAPPNESTDPEGPRLQLKSNSQPDKPSGREKRKFNKNLAGLVAAAAIVGPSTAAADIGIHSVTQESASHNYELTSLKAAGLDNAYTDSRPIQKLASSIPTYYERFQQRNQTAITEFRNYAEQSLAENAENLAAPKSGEIVIAIASDLHSSKAMQNVISDTIKTYNNKYGEGTIKLLAMSGDQSYGTAAERPLVVSQGQLADGQPVAALTGNHGSEITQEQLQEGGVNLLEGETIELGGVALLGATDPEFTKLFGETVPRNEDNLSHAQTGQALYEQALEDRPSVTLLHEGYGAGGFLGLQNVNKQKMKEWFEQGNSSVVPETDNVRNLPTDLLFYGHWHEGNYYRVVKNDDGSHSLVVQLGTAGGAISKPRLGRFSAPFTPPGKEATFAFIFLDTNNDLQVSGYQDISYSTSGQANFAPRVDITDPLDIPGRILEAKQKDELSVNKQDNSS